MNTVTSPQQSSLSRLLALQREEELPPSLVTMPAPTMALLHGLTNAKSDTAAKNAASSAAEGAATPVTVTSRTDPKTGRTVRDIKGLVEGDVDAEVEAAYAIPQLELAKMLAPYARQFGQKEPGGDDIQKKMGSFWGRYHLAREVGESPLGALLRTVGISARPEGREERAAENLARDADSQRLAQAVETFKFVSPVVAEADRQRRMNAAESKELRIREKDLRANIGRTIAATDFTMIGEGEDDWVASVAQQNGLDPSEIDSATRAQIARTGRQQRKKVHEVRFNAFRQDNALGQYETYEKARAAFAAPLSQQEEERLRADWREKRSAVVRAAESQARERARFDAFMAKLATANVEKPQKFGIGDAQVFSADDLVTHIGASNVDQTSLQWTMKRRLERMLPNSKEYRNLELGAKQAEVTVSQILSKAKLTKADLRDPAKLTEKLTKAQRGGLLEPGDAEQLVVALERGKHFLEQARSMDEEAAKLQQGLVQFKARK